MRVKNLTTFYIYNKGVKESPFLGLSTVARVANSEWVCGFALSIVGRIIRTERDQFKRLGAKMGEIEKVHSLEKITLKKRELLKEGY